MSKGLVFISLLFWTACSCQGQKAGPKSSQERKKKDPKGVSPVEVVQKKGGQVEPMAAARPLQMVIRAWNQDASEAERQATELLAQTQAGYSYAVTGDGRVILNPLPIGPAEKVMPTKGTRLQGMKTMIVARERAEIGGSAALMTAAAPWKPGAETKARTLFESGLRQIAKQSGGSGRIYPLRLGAPRIEQGEIRAEITARILRDGRSGLP